VLERWHMGCMYSSFRCTAVEEPYGSEYGTATAALHSVVAVLGLLGTEYVPSSRQKVL
jgi:hypothetical protein